MKTTAGKTKPAKPGERLIQIYALEPAHRGIIAQFNAASLRRALVEFHERMYKHKGWSLKIVGNTAQISKGKSVRSFRALELYQKP